MKRFLSSALAALMLCVTLLSFTGAKAMSDGVLTAGETANILENAANYYNSGVTKDYILSGFSINNPVTVSDAYIMASRAFGELPEPGNGWLLQAADKPSFTDLPAGNAELIAAVENLGNARVILDENEDGLLEPERVFDGYELDTLIERIYGEIGGNLSDAFHATVNRGILADVELLPGMTLAGVTGQAVNRAEMQVTNLLKSIASEEFEPGSSEQKAADFYKAFIKLSDTDLNLSHVQPFFEAIDNAEDTEAVHAVFLDMLGNYGFYAFVAMDVIGNVRGDGSNIYFVLTPEMTMKDAEGGYSDPELVKIAADYNADVLTLIGDSDPEAHAAAFTAFEVKIHENSLSPEDAISMDKAYMVHTLAEVQAVLPSWDLSSILEAQHYTAGDDKLVMVADDSKLKTLSEMFLPENLDILKTSLKLAIARHYRDYLGDSFRTAYQTYRKDFYGIDALPKDEYYVSQAAEQMNLLIQQIYVEQYVDPRTKADVEDIANGLIETFLSRMDNYTWLSESTRNEAKKKLQTLRVMAAYPDGMHSAWDEIDVTSDDPFIIKTDCDRAMFTMDTARYGEKPDESLAIMNTMKTYDVNAMFMPDYNIIYFPAGYLSYPHYDPNASFAQNLGSIGTTIGHEISHAFDNNGSQYDHDGKVRNWWVKADFEAFESKVKDVVHYYDGYEFVPGLENNSTLTVSENIADIGGVSVALEYLKNTSENPDYDTFFRSYARTWADVRLRQRAFSIAISDVHSNGWVRVDAVLPLFDEFYETYGIEEGDGMYVEPDKRVSIW
jgi:putative endopeptidase